MTGVEELAAKRHGNSELPLLTNEQFEGDEVPDALVERLVYRGSTTLLCGASKAGKSIFATQLVMSLPAGERFLGLRVEACPVLLVSLEMTAGVIRQRMEAISEATGLPVPGVGDRFHIAASTQGHGLSLDLTQPAGRERLAERIAETGARVVLLDTLYRFLPGLDPSSNADMGPAFGHMNEIAVSTGAGLVLLDHVSKGEFAGPTSHAALGAVIKGGASNVIAKLERVSHEGAGSWRLSVDSHYGSWDEPLYYQRPEIEPGRYGSGCALVTATQALDLDYDKVRDLFERYGDRDEANRPTFHSQRKLIEAMEQAGLATGNNDGHSAVRALERDLVAHNGGASWERPIVVSRGKNRAFTYTWQAGWIDDLTGRAYEG